MPKQTAGTKIMFWIGWVLSALPILAMGVGPMVMFFNLQMVSDGMKKYGYPPGAALPILIAEMCCAIIYAVPQTAVLGAILMTGYLGGATATHVHAGEPFFIPPIVGVLVWLGLFLRDARVRALVPLRRV
jgi:hypothetical protein